SVGTALLTVATRVCSFMSCGIRSGRRQGIAHDRLRRLEDAPQMILSLKALRIDLVDVFRPGRTSREPTALRNHLQTANAGAVARRLGEDALDSLPGQLC